MYKRIREDGQLSKDDVHGSGSTSFLSGQFAKADASELATRKIVVGQRPTKSEQAAKHICALNKMFAEWFETQATKNPAAELVNGVQDYLDYASVIEDRYLRRVGEVLTFGSGDCGQLAHGVDTDEDMIVKYPRIVHSLRNKKVYGISCGGLHNAVFTEEGEVFTWGCSDDGSLGRDGDENIPVLVMGLQHEVIVGVSCGDGQTIAVSSTGEVWGWGCYKDKEGKKFFNAAENNASATGQVKRQQNEPLKIAGLRDIDGVCCGSAHNLARCTDGTIYSWGIGESGELGRQVPEFKEDGEYAIASVQKHLVPAQMTYSSAATAATATASLPVKNVKNFGCGSYHSMVSLVGDKILVCGLNNYGQLGLGNDDTEMRAYLTEAPLLEGKGVVSMMGGMHHSLMLTSCGSLLTFGRGDSGQLGERSVQDKAGYFSDHPISPVLAEDDIVFKAIACGGNHNLALSATGDIYTWGYGEMLALGNGAERDELVPRKINFTKAKIPNIVVSQVAGGGQHSAIIGTVLQFSS